MADKVETVTLELPATMIVPLGRDIGNVEINLAGMSQATLLGIFEYGNRQVCNDGGSSIRMKDGDPIETRADAVLRRVQELQANEHTFGGGGARLSPQERLVRDWLVEDLTDNKVMKVGDARKAVSKDAEAAFKTLHAATKDERPLADAWSTYMAAVDKEIAASERKRKARLGG